MKIKTFFHFLWKSKQDIKLQNFIHVSHVLTVKQQLLTMSHYMWSFNLCCSTCLSPCERCFHKALSASQPNREDGVTPMGRKAQTSRVNWHVSSLVSRSVYERAITSTVTMDDDLGPDQKRRRISIFAH